MKRVAEDPSRGREGQHPSEVRRLEETARALGGEHLFVFAREGARFVPFMVPCPEPLPVRWQAFLERCCSAGSARAELSDEHGARRPALGQGTSDAVVVLLGASDARAQAGLAAVAPWLVEHGRLEDTLRCRDRFLATLAHELKNPLTGIIAATGLLTRKAPSQGQKLVRRIFDSAHQLGRVIADLRVVALVLGGAPLALQRASHDLRHVLDSAVLQLEAEAARRVRIEATGDTRAAVDEPYALQALSHLLGNALRYGAMDGLVLVHVHATRDAIEVGIHNQGEPIAQAVQASLFQPFRNAREAGLHAGGLGLGLFVSREILRSHHGSLELSSNEHGTRVVTRWPMAPRQDN